MTPVTPYDPLNFDPEMKDRYDSFKAHQDYIKSNYMIKTKNVNLLIDQLDQQIIE